MIAVLVIVLLFVGVAAALILIVDGLRLAFTRNRVHELAQRVTQVEKRQDELAKTLIRVQVTALDDMARLDARCDFFAKQLIKLRLRTMTTAEIDECTAVLADALQNATEPGPPEPGSDDLHMPPADPAQDERKA